MIWTQRGSSRDTLLAAVRAAVEVTERRFEQSDDHLIAHLREELAAVRDLAYRSVGNPADALDTIHQRASRALTKEQ